MEILDNGKIYIVGVLGYDGIAILGVCAEYDFAREFAAYKHKELQKQVDVFEFTITHEF